MVHSGSPLAHVLNSIALNTFLFPSKVIEGSTETGGGPKMEFQ